MHSVLLMATRAEALAYPRGRIDLHVCSACGFIFNASFEPELQEYSGRYEETQSFSPTFRDFHRRLAQDLIERYDVRGKHVLEIGCGKGDFLGLVCQLGGNSGVGFDPAYVPERGPHPEGVDLRFYRETYPPSSGPVGAAPDFVCCKMTLEHVPNVRSFVAELRSSLPDDAGTTVFFQVPDAERVFRDVAFWDVYYEHCSYFTPDALTRLFESCGFIVAETWTDFDGQYLMLTATVSPGVEPRSRCESRADGSDDMLQAFATRATAEAAAWQSRLRAERERGGCACLWGGGSKAVAFLTALQDDLVAFAVDINPHRQGTYLPGSGLAVIGPDELKRLSPTLVIAMNANYVDEIAAELGALGCAAELVALG